MVRHTQIFEQSGSRFPVMRVNDFRYYAYSLSAIADRCIELCSEQEAQLSQRDRAPLRVIEYIAKSLKDT